MSNQAFNVVVGFDFTELADEAARQARSLVLDVAGAELHLVHVIPRPLITTDFGPLPLGDEVLASTSNQLATVLANLALPGYVTADSHVLVGTPGPTIAAFADDIEADLVVLGTHGRKGLRRLLGSVTEQVVRRTHCSVLCARPHQQTAAESIQPPCPECLSVRREFGSPIAVCERHSHRHPQAHTYWETPPSFGEGSMTIRPH